MGNAAFWLRAHRPTVRRLAQLYAALLYNANIKGFLQGKLYTGPVKALCVPGLNCYSCPGAVGACPLGSLQNALAASGHTAGWYAFGILLLFSVLLGRTVCGWLCPAGLIQELLHKIPTPKIRKGRVTRAFSWLKYILLAVLVFAFPLYYGLRHNLPLPAFCKYICPAGTLEGAVSLLSHPDNGGMFAQLGILFTNKIVILLAVGLMCVFCHRAFCRFLCPLGAIYSLFNRFALIGVRVDENRCNHCGACVRHCEMDVRRVNDRECIACGACMRVCAQSAISIRCGRLVLKGPEAGRAPDPAPVRARRKRAGRIVWGGLIALLVFALIWLNWISAPAAPAAEVGSDAPVGYEVGQQLADFTCELIDGGEFHLADHRGQVVVINQWATYCTPCVGELPYFEQLREEHPDIVVLAFHHWLEGSPRARPYIAEKGWENWRVLFAVDTPDQKILQTIGGDNVMPRTVVLNKRGEVVYNEQRSVTYEMLEALLEQAGG